VFQTIKYRLLLSYLTVLTLILVVFAIAVRIIFAHTLNLQLTNRLEILARASTFSLGIKDDSKNQKLKAKATNDHQEADDQDEELEVDTEEILVNANQAVQWFDTKGHLLGKQGHYTLTLPFDPKQTTQVQTTPYPARGLIKPVKDTETGRFIGYVRVSESTQDLIDTLHNLDLGLGVSVVMTLALSSLGGVWLTRQAMQPIEKSFRQLQQFTADASHELRNPLMAIKSNAAVALKYAEGMRDLDAEKFRAIASATTQMTALTEDLLLLARTDQTAASHQIQVNLTTLLQDLIQLYRAEAEVKHIHLKGQIQERLEVLGDAVQLNRLFTNLLSNALRYTDKQGVIEIQTQLEDNQILVAVKDTGIGIAPDQLEHIFDRFWRANRSRSYGSGFGLGLSIAQSIAQHHGGSIRVTSQLGVGSCFTVRFPVHSMFPADSTNKS
jgi:signal transduction histidine kinase